MKIRPAIYVLFVSFAVFTFGFGCQSGQPSYRQQVREEARDRLAVVNARMTYDQAVQSFLVGRFDDAMSAINAAIERYDSQPDFHILRGRIFLETHRLESAMQAFNTALEHDPTSAEAHYYAGIVHQRWSDYEKAYESYYAAFENAAGQTMRVHYLLAAAESMISLRQFDVARQLVESRLTYFEHNAAMRSLLGQIAMLENDPAEAARFFSHARRLNPDDLTILEELAYAHYAAGQFARALEAVRQLRQSPEEFVARRSGGGTASTKGPTGPSPSEVAAQARAKDREWMHLEARCLFHLERSVEARSLYLELSRQEPSNVALWIELGTLSWEIGDYRRLASSAAQVVSLEPDRFEGYMLKGVYEQRRGNTEEAIRQFRQAAERSDDDVLALILLGRVLEETGNFEEASQTYARAARIDPESSEARHLLARLVDGDSLPVMYTGASPDHD